MSDKEFNKFFDELEKIEQEEMLKKSASVLLAESEKPFYAACLKVKKIEKENEAFKQANETLLKTSLNQEKENHDLNKLIGAWRRIADRASNEVEAQQAKIDSLMLEYCPNEMTKEQIKNWEKHQVKSSL